MMYMLTLKSLCERLTSLERTINDAEYTLVILGLLPFSYNAAVNSIANSYEASDKDLTLTAVIWMALNEQEKWRLHKGKDKTLNEAFIIEEHKYICA